MKIKLCSQCNTMKNISDGNVCGRCAREKSVPNPDVTKVEEMDMHDDDLFLGNKWTNAFNKEFREEEWYRYNWRPIETFITKAIATAVKEAEKAFGGCKKCYGKGYATYRHGTRTSADFIGDKSYTTPQETRMLFCVCERGKALEKLIQPK